MAGPSIEGEILIDTQSVEQAEQSVKELETRLKRTAGSGSSSVDKLVKSIREQEKRFKSSADAVRKGSAAQRKLNTEVSKASNLTAKAANKVANFEQKVRDSNVSSEKQNELLQRAGSTLQGYSSATRRAVKNGQSLENVNTELNSSLGQLQRELKESSQSQKQLDQQRRRDAQAAKAQDQANARIQKTLSEVDGRYKSVTNSIRNSNISSDRQAEIIKELDAAQSKYTQTLNRNDASLEEVAAAQRQFRSATTNANNAVKNANKSMSSQNVNGFRQEFQNLTSSVQVALGPLSGVASRLQALQGLFTRNAAAVATLLGSLTGFGVALAKAGQITAEAQKAQLSLEAQIKLLGESARLSGEDVRQMSFDIAQATNLSVQQVREATGTLLEFGGVARNQFDSALKAAQGLSIAVGGGLQQNIRKIGRAVQNPLDGLTRLESKVGDFDEAVRDQIETLTRQGNKFQATQVLLDELSSLQEVATTQAQGLAGAFDAVSDNASILAETVFTNNGALKAGEEAVRGLSDELQGLIGSDEARVIGKLFAASIENLAGSIQFAIDNAKSIVVILGGLSATVLPKAAFALGTLIFKINGLSTAFASSSAAASTFTSSIARARVATIAFATSLPGFRFLTTIATAIAGITLALNAFQEAAKKSGDIDLGQKLKEEVDAVLAANRNITKAQRDQFEAIGDSFAEQANALQKTTDEIKQSLQETGDSIEDLVSRSDFTEGLFGPAANVASKQFTSMKESIEEGSKISQRSIDELSGRARKLALRFNETVEDMQFFKDAVESTKTSVDELKEAIREGDTDILGNLTQEQSLTVFENQLSKLREDFDQTSLKSEELASKLKAAKAQLALGKQGNASEEKLNAIRRVIENIRTELSDIPTENEKIEESIGGVLNTYRDVNQQIMSLNNQLSGGVDLSNQFDIENSADKLQSELKEKLEKNPNALIELGSRLDLDTSVVSELPALISAVITERKKEVEQLEKQKEAQENLNDFLDDQKTKLQEVQNSFAEQRTNAFISGNVQAIEKLDKLNKEAVQSLINENERLANKDFGNDDLKQEFEKRKEKIINALGEENQIAQRLLNELRQTFLDAKIAQDPFKDSRDALQSFRKDSTSEVEKIRQEASKVKTEALKAGDVSTLVKTGDEEKRQIEKKKNQARALAGEEFSSDNIDQQFEERRQKLIDLLGQEADLVKRLINDIENAAQLKKLQTGFEEASNIAGSFGTVLNNLGASSAAKDLQKLSFILLAASKGFAVAKAFQNDDPLVAISKATAALAFITTQAKQIKGAAQGGFIQGPGSSTSDSIPARLSDGEFVVNSSAVDKVGRSTLEQINQGKVPVERASGGPAINSIKNSSSNSNGSNNQVNVQFIDQSSGQKEVEQRETTDSDGAKQFQIVVKDAVKESINKGEMDRELNSNFGLKRKGRRV